MVSKGYLRLVRLKGSRIKYLLTPKGIKEKTRLTYSYLRNSIKLYRDSCNRIISVFEDLKEEGCKKILLIGISELTEVAVFIAKDMDFEIVGILEENYENNFFMDIEVFRFNQLSEIDFDKIIAAKFDEGFFKDILDKEIRENLLMF